MLELTKAEANDLVRVFKQFHDATVSFAVEVEKSGASISYPVAKHFNAQLSVAQAMINVLNRREI